MILTWSVDSHCWVVSLLQHKVGLKRKALAWQGFKVGSAFCAGCRPSLILYSIISNARLISTKSATQTPGETVKKKESAAAIKSLQCKNQGKLWNAVLCMCSIDNKAAPMFHLVYHWPTDVSPFCWHISPSGICCRRLPPPPYPDCHRHFPYMTQVVQ